MASSSATGTTQSMSESRTEALQALFNSMSPEDASRPGEKLSSDQVRKISDKLGELLGDQDIGELIGNQKRNEKGEVLNEEGLPIIDIVEPIKEETPSRPSVPVSSQPIFDDPDLLPHWALSPAEKARRKAERERILDLLEEEERLEQEREEVAARERWHAELEKRKEAAKAELESLRKARDLQKKMGKALLRNVIESNERAEKDKAQEAKDWQEQKARETEKVKKSVSFADELGAAEEKATGDKSGQWGDVALARLRKGKASLLTRAQMENQPLKMDVVERHPGGTKMETPLPVVEADSDDESVPGSPVPADSDEGEVIRSEADSEEHAHHDPPSSDSDATDVEQMSDDGEPVSFQEEDFDYAQHQREIALAYYEKRATIGMEAYSAMRAHSHDEDADEWDQPEVPLEATLASPPPKPSTSRFRSERATEKSSAALASHSLGPSVLPSSQTSSLRKAVRMGKLENGQLVGDESDDDVTEEAKAIVELLSRGEVTNVGPQPKLASGSRAGAPPPPQKAAPPSTGLPEESPTTAKPRSKVSKFKINLAQAGKRDSSPPISPNFPTPQMTSDRSSPKMSSPPPATPVLVPTSTSRQTAGRSHVADVDIPESIRRKAVHGQMPSMIVESPSFRPPRVSQRPGTIVESPSFRPTAAAATSHPSMPSMIVESPDFPPPASARMASQGSDFQSFVLDSALQNAAPTRPSGANIPRSMSTPSSRVTAESRQLGVVMAAEVKESAPPPRRGEIAEQVKTKKVSKFKAEHM